MTTKTPPQTLSEFVIEKYPQYLPLMVQLENSVKIIASKLRKAGLEGNLGYTGTKNVYGEEVQKLDMFANDLIIDKLKKSGQINTILSEELEEPVQSTPQAEYIFCMDPLDGSSNIDVGLNLGTIFSLYPKGDLLQPGKNQILAGYVLYGTSAIMVLTFGDGVYGFTLDEEVDSFFLTHPNIKIPEESGNYSINEGNSKNYKPKTKKYLEVLKTREDIKLRYAAAMVGDIHRFLIKGGIFLYPSDQKRPVGKLRLLYEVSPMSFIMQQAGGEAISTNDGEPFVDPLAIQPKVHDQRVPVVMGSPKNIEEFIKLNEEV